MRPRWAPVALLVAIVAVLVGDAATVVARRGGGGPAATAPGPSGAPRTATPTEKQSTALERALPELQAFVENARGLQFRQPPNVKLLSDAEFEAKLQEETSATAADDVADPADAADQAAYVRFLQALGLLDGDLDLDLDALAEAELDSVVGFYDSFTGALYVRGVELTPYVREVLVHELTHALDDQHFELDPSSLEQDDPGDESATAFEALVEGSAMVVEDRWFESRPAAERASIEEADDAGAADDTVPDLFGALYSFPYVVGPEFVRAVLDAGGQARLAEAFARPPVTTEQILHPARFLAGEGSRAVARPTADGRPIDRGVLGELGLLLMLDRSVDHDVALRAAEGWGGDSYVAWNDGRGRTCVRTNFVMDTPRDATELSAALRTWAARNRGATVSGTATVVVTNCR